MAEKYAVATGNWSAGATWNGGTKPSAGDDVYANGYTVTVDEDTPDTLLSLNTIAGTTAVAGGKFVVTGNRSVYATNINTGSGHAIEYTGSSGTTLNVDVAGGAVNGSSTTNSTYGINITSTGTVNVTGDVVAGNGSARHGIHMAAASTVNVTGNSTGGSSSAARGINMNAGGTVNVTGDAEGATGPGIYMNSGGTVVVTGNANTSGTSYAIQPAGGNCTVEVTGDVDANAVPAIYCSTTGTCTVEATGTVTASSSSPAIACLTATHEVFVSGTLVNTASYMAVWAPRLFLEAPSGLTWAFKEWDETTTFNLYSADVVPGMPSAANVRSGTVFGPSNEFTGTLAVPAAANVALGVAVDAGTGTLASNRTGVHRIGR